VCSNTVEVNNNKKASKQTNKQTNKQTKQAKVQKQKFQKLFEKSQLSLFFRGTFFYLCLK
jgi:hypothetical protein